MAVSQAFIFHFKFYSILHLAVRQLLCWAFLFYFLSYGDKKARYNRRTASDTVKRGDNSTLLLYYRTSNRCVRTVMLYILLLFIVIIRLNAVSVKRRVGEMCGSRYR